MINKKLYSRTQNLFNRHWKLLKDLNKKYRGLVCYLKHNDRKHIIKEVHLDMDENEICFYFIVPYLNEDKTDDGKIKCVNNVKGYFVRGMFLVNYKYLNKAEYIQGIYSSYFYGCLYQKGEYVDIDEYKVIVNGGESQ